MPRYYAIATAIVLASLVAAVLLQRREPPLDAASVQSRGTPSAPRAQADGPLPPSAVSGAAPWALSALPECFTQTSIAHGPDAFVRPQIPSSAQPVVGDLRLEIADCTLHVYANAALVERGTDRLFVPADAHFFMNRKTLYLLRRDGRTEELRSYVLAGGGAPLFFPEAPVPSPPIQRCRIRGGVVKC
ncbi:MAG: hypothetical protein GIW95_11080 [Candidatus Eremiobacteraeota bacterium]|nr:hypothetical protein [Candidatus Eremiobacteraeota bacterium]